MRIGTIQDAAQILRPLFRRTDRELVAVIHLDKDQRLLALTVEGRGTADAVELPVHTILTKALRLGSNALIVAHNIRAEIQRPAPSMKRRRDGWHAP